MKKVYAHGCAGKMLFTEWSERMRGKWITCDRHVETPLFRKVFQVKDIASALIEISGLGYFSLRVNGEKVTEDLFTPALTNYAPRDTMRFHYPISDTLGSRVLYLRYDVTRYLRPGENAVEVIVGNGFYRQKERVAEGETGFADELLTAFDVILTDTAGNETIISTDGTEEGYVYPILESNLFLGEMVDTRLFDEPLKPAEVSISDFTPERLVLQECLPDRVIRTIVPRLLRHEANYRIYDAGENTSGVVWLWVKGERGAKLSLRFAESLLDGELDFISTGGNYKCASGRNQIQRDEFILNGREQALIPLFALHGFRYFDVTGEADILKAEVAVIHTDVPVASGFHCDQPVVNWLYDAYIRSQLTNLHGCIPSDCPHRERLGYTGDGQCCAEAAMLTLDSRKVYDKWIEDILDCQSRENGHIQHTAPFMGGGGGPGGWGCAVVFVPWQYYRRYGDKEMLRHTFPAMQAWIRYMLSRSEGDLLVREEEGGWCLGDWASADRMLLPEPYVNTCYMIRSLDLIQEIAEILKAEATENWAQQAEASRQAVHEKYFHGNGYLGGIQGADAFAIWARLPGHEGLIEGLVTRYEETGWLDTGFLGTDILCEVLFEAGHGDTAVRLLISESEKAGYALMKKKDATTIWEYLNHDRASQNHPMFGACVRQLFTGLLGIKQAEGTAGYTDLVVEPALHTPVRRAEGHIHTVAGRVEVRFDLDEKVIGIVLPKDQKGVCRIDGAVYSLHEGLNEISMAE